MLVITGDINQSISVYDTAQILHKNNYIILNWYLLGEEIGLHGAELSQSSQNVLRQASHANRTSIFLCCGHIGLLYLGF